VGMEEPIGEENVGTAAFGCPAKAKPSASVGTDAFVRPAGKARARKCQQIRPREEPRKAQNSARTPFRVA